MMPTIRLVALAVVLLAGCTPPKPVAYLQSAQDHATLEDVRASLGTPSVMKPLTDGGAEWIYRSWDHEPGSRVTAPGAWCDEYRLLFDAGGVLRHWDHTTTRHQGETMPQTCRRAMARS